VVREAALREAALREAVVLGRQAYVVAYERIAIANPPR
jgi:hypothetical protein